MLWRLLIGACGTERILEALNATKSTTFRDLPPFAAGKTMGSFGESQINASRTASGPSPWQAPLVPNRVPEPIEVC